MSSAINAIFNNVDADMVHSACVALLAILILAKEPRP
jgi:hypothetical protein